MTSSRRLAACLIAVGFLATLTLGTTGKPWTYHIVRSENFTLNCPTLISQEAAVRLLEEREHALAFVEEYLGLELRQTILLYIEPVLFSVSARADADNDGGGTITYFVPASELIAFETQTESMIQRHMGCHEEVHILANSRAAANQFGPPSCLGEGLAELIDSQYRGVTHSASTAEALFATGLLFSLEDLLTMDDPEVDPQVAMKNVYHGGASLCEFLIDRYGLDAFLDLYGVTWFDFQVTGSTVEETRADAKAEFRKALGLSLQEIDAQWRASFERFSAMDDTEQHALRGALQKSAPHLADPILKLENYWIRAPYRLVGPSESVVSLCLDLNAALVGLPSYRGTELRDQLAACDQLISELERMLGHWLEAVHAYEAAVDLGPEAASEALLPPLQRALDGYTYAGDAHMADQSQAWIREIEAR